jgi:hypothetical protein
MKKLFLSAIFLGLVFSTAVAANAGDHAAVASKKNALIYNGYGGDQLTQGVSVWKKILSTVIDAKDGDSRALLINVSAVTGIFTANTNVEVAQDLRAVLDSARIQVAVKVDGKWAKPGLVTFDSLLRMNIDSNTPNFVNLDLTEQTAAHSFSFYQVGIAPTQDNDHTVEVFARISIDAQTFSNSGINMTEATAFIGPRTLTVTTAKVDLDENE